MVWENTPFSSIEEAACFAVNVLHVAEPAISETKGFLSFKVESGGDIVLIAQAVDGGPVRQCVVGKAPKRKRKSRRKRHHRTSLVQPGPRPDPNRHYRKVGKWVMSDHATLQGVQEYWKGLTASYKELFRSELLAFEIDGDIYEYVRTADGRILVRVLTPLSAVFDAQKPQKSPRL